MDMIDDAKIDDGYDFSHMFTGISKFVKNSDLAIGTLETNFIDGKYSGVGKYNSPVEFLKAVKDSGIGLVSLAHNHVLDYGTQGLETTISKIKEQNVEITGIKNKVDESNESTLDEEKTKEQENSNFTGNIKEINGIKVAFLGYTYGLSNENEVTDEEKKSANIYSEELAQKDIEYAKQNSNYIIAIMHWGDVNSSEISEYQRKITSFLVENGVDMILGSHPSVVEPMEIIQTEEGKNVLVAYSLGNYISTLKYANADVELILNIQIAKSSDSDKAILQKVDYTPIDGKIMDLGRIAELGNEGILALMSDSTNAERKGFTMSESSIGPVFDNLFDGCTKRIVVATFASNVHRVQQIVSSAVKYKRKIAICGRSMINMITTAKDLGYIDCPDDIFIDIDTMSAYNDEQLVIITTGSQGETMSALTRMAAGDHRKVKITPNDLVIISANPIPGNEKSVSKVIDDLMQIGAEVVYSALADVHVSGHACQEEQKLIITLAKPKFFIPVHGEYRQLIAHAETAKKLGIEPKNIFIMSNGRTLELNENEATLTTSVPNGKVLVDGLGVGDVGNIVLRDRQHLSQDGLIVIVVAMDSSTGEIISEPDVVSRGFVYVRESENLMDDIKKVIYEEIRKCEENHITDWSTIKSNLKDTLRDYIFEKTKRNPMILPIITEV